MSFQFKHFTITQDNTAMKVGTDGVLLGAWSNHNGNHFLDIGTGTGLIALMLAQRNSTAVIDAIEIDKAAAEQAKDNFNNSTWSERLTILNSSIQDFKPAKKYDLIVCNPPFFINSTKAPNQSRTTARHNDDLPFDELINTVKRLLSTKGIFSVILPIEEGNQLIDIANKEHLNLNRKCIVKPNPNKNPKRILMEFSFVPSETKEEEITIETENRHEYTKEYITLTKDFYLKF